MNAVTPAPATVAGAPKIAPSNLIALTDQSPAFEYATTQRLAVSDQFKMGVAHPDSARERTSSNCVEILDRLACGLLIFAASTAMAMLIWYVDQLPLPR